MEARPTSAVQHPRSSAAHIDTQLRDIAAAQGAGRVSCSCTGVPHWGRTCFVHS